MQNIPENIQQFFAELAMCELPNSGRFTENKFFFFEGIVIVEFKWFDGKFWLESIVSQEPKQGYASKVMQRICELLEKHNVDIFIYVKPFGTDRNFIKSVKVLKQFYAKYKFFDTGKKQHNYMVRKSVSNLD